jgi:hypothetical protein
MFASLVLASAMFGQSIDNYGKIWTGSHYVVAVYDTTKPIHFSGGGLSMDLYWNPALDGYGGGFQSLPFVIGTLTRPVWLEFYPRFDPDGNTWALCERDGRSVGDWMIEFNTADAGPKVDVTGRTTWQRMWAINRAGATNFRLNQ